jgi:hypothetical protein
MLPSVASSTVMAAIMRNYMCRRVYLLKCLDKGLVKVCDQIRGLFKPYGKTNCLRRYIGQALFALGQFSMSCFGRIDDK